MSHSGSVTTSGQSNVELSDEEVDILVKLIREKGTTDVDELDLETSHPELYAKLDDAYRDMAFHAEYMHWLWEGYYNHYYEYDDDALMTYCETNCGFTFEFKPEDYFDYENDIEDYKEDPDSYEDEIYEVKCEAFNEWLTDYLEGLSDDDAASFMEEHMDADINMDYVNYTVKIPQAIIGKAQQ